MVAVAENGTFLGILLICGLAAVGAGSTSSFQSSAPTQFQQAETERSTEAPVHASPASVGNGYASYSIDRSPDSHFYVDAQVNGATIRFLVDTGASGVVLAPQDAQRAGIYGSNFTAVGVGAGGEIQMMPTTVSRLAIGPLSADNVSVMVAKDKLAISLLGQSYLSRVGTVSISGDTMTLK